MINIFNRMSLFQKIIYNYLKLQLKFNLVNINTRMLFILKIQ